MLSLCRACGESASERLDDLLGFGSFPTRKNSFFFFFLFFFFFHQVGSGEEMKYIDSLVQARRKSGPPLKLLPWSD